MPRDYANSPKPKHPHSLPGWIWMLGGLFVGLFVSLLFYIMSNSSVSPNKSISDSVHHLIDKFKDTREVRTSKEKAPPPPEDGKKDKPKFDFYTILPELEVVIPDHDLVDEGKQNANDSKGKTQQSGPSRYIIQAGSFRSLEQADRLKARLALYGIEATIQTVTINNNDTWHRVRIGPMTDLTAINKTRKRLQDNGIATMVVKEKS